MRNYIVQEKNIEDIIPMNDIITGKLNELINQGVILDLAVGRFKIGDIEYKQVFFNFIEDDLLAYCISQGYEINWLKPYNYPYIELDEGTDIGELYIYENQRKRKDGKMLIRIDKAGDQQNPLLPTFEELKEWQKLGSIICEPKTVEGKMSNYTDSVDLV